MSIKQRIRREQLIRQTEGYLELGMYQEGLQTLERLESGQDGSGESLDGHAIFLRGEAYRSLERYQEAQKWLKRAADRMPDNVHIWLALGWCYKRTGRIDRAIRALEAALAVDPSEAIIHYNLACYWSISADKSRALGYLAQALDIDSNYRDLISEESDFDTIRDDPDFQSLASVIV